MDYSSWSRCEKVPLSNGIITRRTGLHFMKPSEEIRAYYYQHFGKFWFNELPKTDNTYSPTSKYYGCTLAPGIPLIPNLCRRPLRSPGSGEYDYTFTPFTQTPIEESNSNNHNSWIEKNNIFNNNHDNGTSNNHIDGNKMRRRIIEFQDSGLDSDSDYDDSPQQYSQNTVTWLSWIITTVTTIITVITETVVGKQDHQNHVNTRVPLKQNGGVSWYQYPMLWLYKLAMLVHRADIWLLYKVHSILRLDSWGTSEQRRRWALIILLIPLILWAGFKLVEWLWADEPWSEGVTSPAWILSPLFAAWDTVTTWFSDAWGWFDGSWLWAPWMAVVGWFGESTEEINIAESTESTSEVDWSGLLSFPFYSVAAFFTTVGGIISSAVSSVGEGTVIVFTAIGTFLSACMAWIVDFFANVPTLLSSALAMAIYPFSLVSWESSPVDYTHSSPPPLVYSASSAPVESPSLEHLVRDKHLLALLVRQLLNSEEFNQALADRQSVNEAQVNSAVDSAFAAALSKIDHEFNTVKKELDGKIRSEDNSVETKMDALKQQIQDLQMALTAHKALVSEQAVLGNRLEARVTTAEQLKMQEDQEQENLKEEILLEVAKVKEEIIGHLTGVQSNQKVVVDSGDYAPTPHQSELEALINSTVERLLVIYDADKIAKVDYALASSGGSVLNVRCTETFSKKNAQYYMWGYPLWSRAPNDPRIALEPSINPGECWAFSGSRGYLVIDLSENITVTAFTLEHLPRSLCPSGTIDTAPKDFRVLGLESEHDETPILLGRFRYEDNGASLQHFQALEVDHTFKIVELVVESNHGNLEYTCLYRFRVHGKPVRLPFSG